MGGFNVYESTSNIVTCRQIRPEGVDGYAELDSTITPAALAADAD